MENLDDRYAEIDILIAERRSALAAASFVDIPPAVVAAAEAQVRAKENDPRDTITPPDFLDTDDAACDVAAPGPVAAMKVLIEIDPTTGLDERALQRTVLLALMTHFGGRTTAVAGALGVAPSTVCRRLKRLGLARPQPARLAKWQAAEK